MDEQTVWREVLDLATMPIVVEPVALEMTRSRIYGKLAGYQDCNDHDALRQDAVFKLLAGRSRPGQSTYSIAIRKRHRTSLSISP